MLTNIFSNSNLTIQQKFIYSAIFLIVIILSLTFHEMSHAFVAYKLGDPTARNLGRLSLNPFHHLDPIGTVSMLLFGFGWAKPVPVNSRYFKKPKRDMALTAFAGPVSNLIIAFMSTPLLLLFSKMKLIYVGTSLEILFYIFKLLFGYFLTLNLSLAIFNMIPIPPLDGSRILYIFLPDKIYFSIMKYEKYTWILLIVCLYFLSYTGIISTIITFIKNLFVSLWSLIPFLS